MPPRAPRMERGRGAAAQETEPAEAESASLRSLRDLAACADELAGASLTTRLRRVLAGLGGSLQADTPQMQQAWSCVWVEPRLRIALLLALRNCTQRLAQLTLRGAAEDDDTCLVLVPCFLALSSGFHVMLGCAPWPKVAPEVRTAMIKLAVDTDLVHALARLVAATAEAQEQEARRRITALRAVRSARALRSASANVDADTQAETRLATVGNCVGLLCTFAVAAVDKAFDVPITDAAVTARLQDAVERSGALDCMAHAAVTMAVALAEVAAARDAAAAAVGGAGGGASGSRSAVPASRSRGGAGSGQPQAYSVHENAARYGQHLLKSIHGLWEQYVRITGELGMLGAGAAAVKGHRTTALWLERLLSRPCVQHLLLQHMVAQVAAADGGGSYGLTPPQQLPAAMISLPHRSSHTLGSFSAGVGPGDAVVSLIFAEASNTALEMWTLAGVPGLAEGTGAGAAEGVGGSSSSSGRGAATASRPAPAQQPDKQPPADWPPADWPPGTPWQPSIGAVTIGRPGSGGLTGRLRRPAVPVGALEALLLRAVGAQLTSLAQGLRFSLQKEKAGAGGAAAGRRSEPEQARAPAALFTPGAAAQPATPGVYFAPRSSLLGAARALMLAISNRQLHAQQRLRLQQTQSQSQSQSQQGAAAAAAGVTDTGAGTSTAASGSAAGHDEAQGNVRALWQPLARVAHACVDAAVMYGVDLGSKGLSDGWELGGGAEVHHAAVAPLPLMERLMSPCGGLRMPPLPAGHNALFTLLPAPLPSQAAALASGYLGALERLLRALHRTLGSKREQGHRLLGGFGLFASHVRAFQPTWAVAFAYGPPQEVAALVATSATVMRLMALTTDGTWQLTDCSLALGPTPTGAPTDAASLHVRTGTPGEMAMRRRLLHGPNMLRGLLAWLADSVAGDSAAIAADGATTAAAAAAAAAAGIAPDECWWQRRWSRRLASERGAASLSAGGGGGGNSSNLGAEVAAADWGLPRPALQALALASFTLRRWLQSMSRAAQHLCAKAHAAVLNANVYISIDPRTRATCAVPFGTPAEHDDDWGHAGTHTRAAAGAARLVFEAAAPLGAAFTACKEFAEAARARASSDSGGGGGGSGSEAMAVAAEAELEAEAWKRLLLECVPPCITSATQLLAIGPSTHMTLADVAWPVHALLQLVALLPEEASRALGEATVEVTDPFSGTRVRAPVATTLSTAVRLQLQHAEAGGRDEGLQAVKQGLAASLGTAQAVLERGGRLGPEEREALLAGCAAVARWCGAGSRNPAQPDWARRVGLLLPPPGMVGVVLGLGPALEGCSNPACVAMPGDSAAGVPARRCGGRCGGVVLYCSDDCQAAHWKAPGGHKGACGKK